MKKTLFITVLFCLAFSVTVFSETEKYDSLKPESRIILSESWVETGKGFLENQKMKDAKACFLYANELYPMGTNATEARKLLKDNFKVNLSYNPEKQFKYFVKRAENYKKDIDKQLNNYLMALEINQDKEILYKTAVLFFKQDNKEKAKEFLLKAVAAGLEKSKVDANLAGMLE